MSDVLSCPDDVMAKYLALKSLISSLVCEMAINTSESINS